MSVNYREWASKQYKSKRWQQVRARQLAKHPYCQCPHHKDMRLKADDKDFGGAVCDHIIPHKGDPKLFWSGPFQTLTKQCHDKFKRSLERGGAGFLQGCDVNGNPLSDKHEWWT